MKVLIDMNLSPRWVNFLLAAAIDASHWSTIGAANAHDEEIMWYAREKDYVVLTHDLDFGAILAATQRQKPSVLQIRSLDISPEKLEAVSSRHSGRCTLTWSRAHSSLWIRTAPVCAFFPSPCNP